MESTTKPTTEIQSGEESPLLLCPFCGESAHFAESYDGHGEPWTPARWEVNCSECNAKTDSVAKTRADAAEEWNLRHEADGLLDEWRQLYNCASFDWDTMPEAARRKFREVVLETAERALSQHNSEP